MLGVVADVQVSLLFLIRILGGHPDVAVILKQDTLK